MKTLPIPELPEELARYRFIDSVRTFAFTKQLSEFGNQCIDFGVRLHEAELKETLKSLCDVKECLSRLKDADGAYRVTVLGQVKKEIAKLEKILKTKVHA